MVYYIPYTCLVFSFSPFTSLSSVLHQSHYQLSSLSTPYQVFRLLSRLFSQASLPPHHATEWVCMWLTDQQAIISMPRFSMPYTLFKWKYISSFATIIPSHHFAFAPSLHQQQTDRLVMTSFSPSYTFPPWSESRRWHIDDTCVHQQKDSSSDVLSECVLQECIRNIMFV